MGEDGTWVQGWFFPLPQGRGLIEAYGFAALCGTRSKIFPLPQGRGLIEAGHCPYPRTKSVTFLYRKVEASLKHVQNFTLPDITTSFLYRKVEASLKRGDVSGGRVYNPLSSTAR